MITLTGSVIGSALGSFLHSLLAFMIILVPLVVFHEFGHYVFARIFGVKAEIFSIGFGPRLWSRQLGETELRISAIPMGGYVKLLGEDRESELTPAEQKRSLHRQKPWKRFFIFLGGPLFNFILAIFIFMAILVIGEPQLANVVGRVVEHSAAEKAGFRSGDRIVAIDGKPVKKFEEIAVAFHDNPDKKLNFSVLHPDASNSVDLPVVVSSQEGYSVYGELTRVGDIEGLMPIPRAAQIGVSDPSSIIGRNGIQSGERIVQLNGEAISTWEELESGYSKLPPGASFSLQIKNQKSGTQKEVVLSKPPGSSSLAEDFGLYSSELFVERVIAKSPAEAAGVLAGDRLVSIGNQEVYSFFELRDAVQKSGEKDGKVTLKWERKGEMFSATMVPTATSGRDPVLNKVTQYTIGVAPMLELGEPVTIVERVLNPFKLIYLATIRMVTFSERNLVSLKKMVTGDVSVGNLGGPIMIGKVAGESLTRGLIAFLTNMAVFSIGLGVLNILPVPVLDGGHLLLLGVEIIRRKPLSLKQLEVVQGIGLLFILALMGIAFHNDLARLIYS